MTGSLTTSSATTSTPKMQTEVTSNASGGKLTFGIFLTLWSASAGVDTLRVTLNEVYDLKETRSGIWAKTTSVLLTLAIGVLLWLAFALIAYGSQQLSGVLPDRFAVHS